MEALAVAAKSFVVINAVLVAFAYILLFERKILGWMQYRKGPNRVGPWGLLQPIADAVKMFLKEDIIPKDADRLVFQLAPIVSLAVALTAFAFVPIGPGLAVVKDADAGMLALMAVLSLEVYGVALGGWASQSKYALMGALRSTAQLISYELAMGMTVLAVFIMAGSTRFDAIVASQEGLWNIVRMPLAFLLFFIAMLAETARTPFDLPESESELVAGYHTEYSGMRFGMFFMAEYVNLVTATALITLLFLGGWLGPAFLPGWVWFLLKQSLVIFLFIWIRATLPRFRYDRLMAFGWKVMLPLAALNLVVYATWAALA
ncbi:MAG: NADH-quinone oxidoreductase subunit NuoH [Firmicutes bacterium]|nr:NADH-quinone oxidoreductase subunit NuoH [Bacillota bacterium]